MNKQLLLCENEETLPAPLQDYFRRATARVLFVGAPHPIAGACCEMTAAGNGEEGVLKAHQCKPDLIVMDAKLLDEAGFNVCAAIHANHATRSIPIVVIG